MADKQPKDADVKSVEKEPKGETQEVEQKQKGEQVQEPTPKEDFNELLKERDGTISSLTKKLNEMEDRMKAFAGISEEEDEPKKDPFEAIEAQQREIQELRKENALQKLTSGMVDEDGEPLPQSIKDKALESVDVSRLDPVEAVEAVKKQAKTLYDIYKEARTVSDKAVEKETKRTTANEYIDREITIIK